MLRTLIKMNNNFNNFKQVISYTKDRIYCAGECHGRFNEEIDVIVVKLREYILANQEYDPLQDIDEEGNNPLHLVAKNGLYEFFDMFHSHKSFDNLKNMPNNKNETPLDLVKFRMYDSILLINPSCSSDISIMVTKPYYSESFPKLEKIMIECGCLNNFRLTEMLISMASENLEKITSDKFFKEESIKTIEMSKIFCSTFLKNTRPKDDEDEDEDEKVREQIDDMKKQYEPLVLYLQKLISELKKLPSDEINSFDDLIKLSRPAH